MMCSYTLCLCFRAAIVFVVTGRAEFNFADQRSMQYEIHDLDPKLPIKRVQFDRLNNSNLRVDADRRLFMYV